MIADPVVKRDDGESPAVARRRLRLALRRLRESLGLTQADVSGHLRWSLSKVNRMETGEVTISAGDLEAILAFFGISDGKKAAQLAQHCRLARRRGWWDRSEIRPHLTPALTNLLQFESDAAHIMAFGPSILPGIIQTHAMAAVILADYADVLTEEQRAARFTLRMRLREQAIGRESGTTCTVVLDESVVLREFGGLRLLASQLEDMLEAVDDQRLDVRILPFTAPTLFGLENPFMLVELDDGDTVLYREGITDEFFDDGAMVDRYRRIFERQLEGALSPAASVRLVKARLAAIESALDRL
ncbi:transcriptional regulator [Virgisporangium aurantiacum]|uniref:Transcriptional regulator n=1 Tax=Virgisporangium aurantiacum TaxID=175570 RepID=A0A8J3ZBS6_9ACTN|nr:transcriptional regulator [Virgisporangium aurantiacum]